MPKTSASDLEMIDRARHRKSRRARRALPLAVLGFLGLLSDPAGGRAESVSVGVRVALLSQWVVDQHRGGGGHGRGALRPEIAAALAQGVVDRVVFWPQRGLIQRGSLVPKPIRTLAGAESTALGGRGEFALVDLRPPRGAAGWTEVEIAPRTARPGDVLVLEIGGELSPATQVLESLFIWTPNGSLVELKLVRSALIRGQGVPVIGASFGRPLGRRDASALFRGLAGVEFVVARSLVEAMVDAATTARGSADASPPWVTEWREGDRVLVRIPLAVLRERTPAIVLGWKDRVVLSPLGDGGR